MRLAGRIAGAIEVLAEVDAHRRPASEALKAWGLANRFAGAGDRAAIGNFVYDALRRRASHGFAMGDPSARAAILSVAIRDWGLAPEALVAAFEGDAHAPAALTPAELQRLSAADPLAGAPEPVRADLPEWIVPELVAQFGEGWIEEGAAMTGRPPLDLRVNALKSDPARVGRSLARFHPEPGLLPNALRLPAGPAEARTPNVLVDEAYLKGWFEVQDQGSQLSALLAGAKPGEQVLDLCAGAGGKTLAMAAEMGNKGQIFAHDSDRARLAPIYDRLKRAGVRNAQVRAPAEGALDDLVGKIDRVVIDAPCTGSGTWRRRPDAKWRLSAGQLADRVAEQAAILDEGVRYVKPGGTLVYITCSILDAENGAQAAAFLARHPDFAAVPADRAWHALMSGSGVRARFVPAGGLAISPNLTGTDGFFVFSATRAP